MIEALQKTAYQAAWQAGQIIRETIDSPTNIHDKGPRDLVTDTDHAAQKAIIDVIRNTYPDHHILAEEDTTSHTFENGRWTIPDGVVWIIDPLDGTTNFTRRLPVICTSVAAVVDGDPVVGAIFDPLRDEFFVAGKGLGATLNEQPLPMIKPRTLSDAVVALDWSHAPARRNRALRTVGLLADKCRTIRSLGSAALALTYVAAGRLGLYFNFGLQPWDQAAASVMISMVGGEIIAPDGNAWKLGDQALMAGHPALLAEVQSLL